VQAGEAARLCEGCPGSVSERHRSELRLKAREFLVSVLPGKTTLAELDMLAANVTDMVETQWKTRSAP